LGIVVLDCDYRQTSPQALTTESKRLPPETRAESHMPIEDFSPTDMQTLMHAIERLCIVLKLTDSEDHLQIRSRVSALIIECAESGERDVQKLVDCAHAGLSNGGPR
jgi:hypothetical protein